MPEQFRNRPTTTLSAGYTSGGGSISVTSASGFPTTGVFRVLLGNPSGTIYRVDSVSGTTFTGGAEEFDANASNGATVQIVASRAAAERFVQSPEGGTSIHMPSGVSGADRYGPVWRIGDPTTVAWAWQNQGGASVVEANGIVFLTVPSASTSIRSRIISAPGTPWTATTLLRSNAVSATSQYAGIVLRESSTSKLYIYYILANSTIQAVKFTNDTTFSAVGAVNVASPVPGQDWHWLRITDNGTNLLFLLSTDGVNFVQYGSESRTAFMGGGPNQFGIFGNVDSAAAEFTVSFASWRQT